MTDSPHEHQETVRKAAGLSDIHSRTAEFDDGPQPTHYTYRGRCDASDATIEVKMRVTPGEMRESLPVKCPLCEQGHVLT